jgi:hypothetical protein
MFFSPKSREEELNTLDDGKWSDIIKGILKGYHLIAMGYGGNDGGLMEILGAALKENSKAKIYWCYRDEQPNKLQQFSE